MDMSERQTIKRVIKPKQDFILDAIEEVLINYGINLDLYFAPLTEEVVEVKEETAELNSHVCMSEDI
jgi:ribosome biogenesis protein Nip4